MANDSISVSGPVRVESDSKQRVAYDLMNKVLVNDKVPLTRKNILELYSQCYQVVNGTEPQYVSPKVE